MTARQKLSGGFRRLLVPLIKNGPLQNRAFFTFYGRPICYEAAFESVICAKMISSSESELLGMKYAVHQSETWSPGTATRRRSAPKIFMNNIAIPANSMSSPPTTNNCHPKPSDVEGPFAPLADCEKKPRKPHLYRKAHCLVLTANVKNDGDRLVRAAISSSRACFWNNAATRAAFTRSF